MQDEDQHYSIAELAQIGGVSRRTVRYYVQRGLLPTPTGTGRGKHYKREHLERLIRVRQWQEEGVSLAEIEKRLQPQDSAPPAHQPPAPQPQFLGEQWTHIRLADGLELKVRQPSVWKDTTLIKIIEAIRQVLIRDKASSNHGEKES